MRLANPAGLLLLLLAVPVIVLHLLRPKRPTFEVSSTYLWQEMSEPVSAASPWQRLRWTTLLILQLLAVALLAVAVAQPVRLTAAPLSKHTVFIIDTSGSMGATDAKPDRLASARRRANDLRRELPVDGIASIVVASSQPRVVLSSSADRRAFADALDPLRTEGGGADFAGAFTLAESLETPGAAVGFVLLSDGVLDDASRALIPPGTRFEKVGERSTNRGITRLTVEPRGSGLHARVSVRNAGRAAATQPVRIDVDGQTVATARVKVPGNGRGEAEVDVPAGDRVEAFLEGEDLLGIDDRAVAVAGRRRTLRVLHAGPENVFLERLLEAMPALEIERSLTTRAASGFDLAIYDQVPVPPDPGAPFLAVAPGPGVPGVKVTGELEGPVPTLVRSEDPLLQGLDVSDVAISKAQRLQLEGHEVLVGAEGGALLVRGAHGAFPFMYLSFALGDSNLPLQVAFPLLFDRIVTDLAGSTLPPADLRVGQPLPVVATGAPLRIESPGGVTAEVAPGSPPPVADRPGFWTVLEEGRPDRVLAVNPEPSETDIAPASSLPIRPREVAPGERRPSGEARLLPWVAALLLLVLAVELIISRRSRGVRQRQWRAALVLRGLIVALVIAALLGVALPRSGRRVATMFLIDASASMGGAGREDAVAWVREALRSQPDGTRAGVALFGGDARLELTVQERAELLDPAVEIDATRTNLAGALRLAAAVLPADARRRIVVVSDGRATEGDAAMEASRLRDAGVRVDVHLIERSGTADLAVQRLDAPSLVRQGETIALRATLHAPRASTARLVLRRDGVVVDERSVDVVAGETVVELPQPAGASGLARFRVEVSGPDDAVPENDIGFAAVQVEGPAKVLLVEGATGAGAELARALRAGGLEADVVETTGLPALDRLSTYTGTVLVDVDARALSLEQVATLAAATKDLGRGLVTVGGDRSYGLGGYLSSELEQLLPVISDVKDPKRRDSVAQVLAIDASGSMGTCHCAEGGGANGMAGGGNRLAGGVKKTDIARAAAKRTIEALHKDDQVGVLAFNTEQKMVVPLQKVPSADVVEKGLGSIKPAGGTDLRQPLQAAATELRKANARLKHIILFTDGFTDVGGLDALVDQAAQLAAEGITVSVLATGEGASEKLRAVAEAGKGRFYPGRDLSKVPEIMVEEALVASRSFVNEGEFLPKVTSSSAPVRELSASPPLLGYIATTPRPSAETSLRIGDDDDPLLATWQAGLGRVSSWTSDAAPRWSKHWLEWDGYVAFWAAVVKDTFPGGAPGDVAIRARTTGDRMQIVVESATPFADGATATARVAGPDLVGREVALERTSATTFAAEVPATTAGSYAIGALVVEPGRTLALSTMATQSYAAEFLPGEADRVALERISKLSGGRGSIEPARAFDAADLPEGSARIALAGLFLLLAALLWPLDIALRRLSFHGTGLAAVRSAPRHVATRLRSRLPARPGADAAVPAPPGAGTPSPPPPPRKRPKPEPAPPPTLGRLLDRKRGTSTTDED